MNDKHEYAGSGIPERAPGIADFRDGEEAANPWVAGRPEAEKIVISEYDPSWPERFAAVAAALTDALGSDVVAIAHVGSTAVPGLAAKDVIDIDLTVADPAAEDHYVPALERLGYRLTVREPAFEEHRMLRLDKPRVNLHVYGPGAAESARHLVFRDWLRATPPDRALYETAKRDAAAADPESAAEYSDLKSAVVREIYSRAFAAGGVPLRDRALAPAVLPPLPATAGGEAVTWRPAQPDDAVALYELHRDAGTVDHPKDLYSLEVIKLGMTGERFSLATDAIVGSNARGEVIAYGKAHLGDTLETEVSVSLDGVIHPEWRGRGLGRPLLRWQEARARQLLASCGSDLPAMISLDTREENTPTIGLFRSEGFLPVRWWMELWRDLTEAVEQRALPDGVRLQQFTPELSEATRVALNDAFRDHWGSQPTSKHDWDEELALDDFAPQHSYLAVAEGSAPGEPQRVLAAVLSEITEDEWELNGGPFGYMSDVGVVRDARGKGLSSALMRAALESYRSAGLIRAALSVDAANPSGALAMYTKLGFTLSDRSVTYAKRA